ncbi:MAG: N-acetylmuramoyl-L-alanine amidase [Armatimonadota bacterium]|nr:N-acetylmuramoyl-L-alanine amidase [bacterium]
MRVCLDAGHGRKNNKSTGAPPANGIVEDDWALMFAQRLGHYLRASGAETVFTRTDKAFVALASRGALAKAKSCDFFLSIHLNSAVSDTAHGCEAFVALNDKRSQAIAAKLASVVFAAGMHARGVKWDNQGQHKSLRVLRDTYGRMPAVLIEMGFVTNISNARRLSDKIWCEKAAEAMARAIINSYSC